MNSHITENQKPIYKKTWIDNQNDIIDNYGLILKEEEIGFLYKIWMKPLEYNSLISAIPKEWKQILKENKHEIGMAKI